MSAWLKRNTGPILIVVAASAVVIGGSELLDSLSTSQPFEAEGASAALTVGGLVKVALFMLIPGLITLAVRRHQREP